jgi:hypothetical protein
MKDIKIQDFNKDGVIDKKDYAILKRMRRNAQVIKNKKNTANLLNSRSTTELRKKRAEDAKKENK